MLLCTAEHLVIRLCLALFDRLIASRKLPFIPIPLSFRSFCSHLFLSLSRNLRKNTFQIVFIRTTYNQLLYPHCSLFHFDFVFL